MIDSKSTEVILRAVRARQQFWIEQLDRARADKNDEAAGDAQRLIDEYDAFIDVITRTSDEHGLTGYTQARR